MINQRISDFHKIVASVLNQKEKYYGYENFYQRKTRGFILSIGGFQNYLSRVALSLSSQPSSYMHLL